MLFLYRDCIRTYLNQQISHTTLFVRSRLDTGIVAATGWVPFLHRILNRAGGFRPIEPAWRGLAQDMIDTAIIALRGVGSLKPGIGTLFDMYEFITDTEYRLREAIYNQFDSRIWTANSPDIVDLRFNYVMAYMSTHMALGNIEIQRTSDHFSLFPNETARSAIDPLTGQRRMFQPNNFYFFALNENAHDLISNLEARVRNMR